MLPWVWSKQDWDVQDFIRFVNLISLVQLSVNMFIWGSRQIRIIWNDWHFLDVEHKYQTKFFMEVFNWILSFSQIINEFINKFIQWIHLLIHSMNSFANSFIFWKKHSKMKNPSIVYENIYSIFIHKRIWNNILIYKSFLIRIDLIFFCDIDT